MQQSQHRSQYWKHCLKSSTELLSRAASESIYVYTCVCVCMYIYIYRERERENLVQDCLVCELQSVVSSFIKEH